MRELKTKIYDDMKVSQRQMERKEYGATPALFFRGSNAYTDDSWAKLELCQCHLDKTGRNIDQAKFDVGLATISCDGIKTEAKAILAHPSDHAELLEQLIPMPTQGVHNVTATNGWMPVPVRATDDGERQELKRQILADQEDRKRTISVDITGIPPTVDLISLVPTHAMMP